MNIRTIIAIALLGMPSVAYARGGSVTVRGYTTRQGTPVPTHQRTAPNKTKRDNWSTKGNTNPYTGKPGTKSSQ